MERYQMLGEIIGAAANLVGGIMGGQAAKANMQKQLDYQASWNKHRIATTVRDAKDAGVSPLFALGANTPSFAPVSVGDTSGMSGLGEMGQSIGRALDANQPQSLKGTTVLQTAAAQAQIEGIKLDNEIKRTRLASDLATLQPTLSRPGLPDAAMPTIIDGQGNSGFNVPPGIKVQKTISPATAYTGGSAEAGVTPDVSYTKSTVGHVPMVPTQVGEALESQPLGAAQWAIRNQIMPMFSPDRFNPPYKAKSNEYWTYNPITGEYILNQKVAPRPHLMYPSRFFNDGRG